jgi:hypothetical protein
MCGTIASRDWSRAVHVKKPKRDALDPAKFYSAAHDAQPKLRRVCCGAAVENEALLTERLPCTADGNHKKPLQGLRYYLLDCGPFSTGDESELLHRLWIEGVYWK